MNLFFSIVGASSWVSPAEYFVTVGPTGFSRPLFSDGRSYQDSPLITFVTVGAVGPVCVSPAEPVFGGLDRTEHKPDRRTLQLIDSTGLEADLKIVNFLARSGCEV